ncbi:MAG: tRNA lysidine(34) synthetase TilS [Actinobacteria bacterium]|nr:MAG: tRNA lysidine(34) synthetase TilS [Actinomycetota bacterium]
MDRSCAATVQVRNAVERALGALEPGDVVLVACSGGPDSLALAAATGWVAKRLGLFAGAVIVDHQLQEGSAEIAAWAAEVCERLGLSPVEVVAVQVDGAGGLEAAARDVRYAALTASAQLHGCKVVLLGHTQEDQAETVLLRLTRGSGARSLSAMAAVNGLWHRPLLDTPRAVVHESATEVLTEIGEVAWRDPHNLDTRFARVRVRQFLESLGDELGPGVIVGLARSASMLRDDADALDELADALFEDAITVEDGVIAVEVNALDGIPRAIRTRVVRAMCLAAGVVPGDLSRDHVLAVDQLVAKWTGQGPAFLPGGVQAQRTYDRLKVSRPTQ